MNPDETDKLLDAVDLDELHRQAVAAAMRPPAPPAGRAGYRRPQPVRAIMPESLRHAEKVSRRRFIEPLISADNARAALRKLPRAGEAVHMLLNTEYSLYELILAVIELAAEPEVAEAHIATLGINRAHTDDIASRLKTGEIKRLTLLCSEYFRQSDAPTYDYCADQLRPLGAIVAATRSHAKVAALKMGNGATYTLESSANLRTCRSIEQSTISADPRLRAFHARWIADLAAHGDTKPEAREE